MLTVSTIFDHNRKITILVCKHCWKIYWNDLRFIPIEFTTMLQPLLRIQLHIYTELNVQWNLYINKT